MIERPIDLVLSRLKNVKPCGDGYQANCPCHEDHSPSLSISAGTDGRALLQCFAGCATEHIVHSLGLTMADLFPGSNASKTSITVADLATNKRIPESFLRSLGLVDREDGVVIPYRLADGSVAPRKRLRTALRAKDGSLWLFGRGNIVPYGLERLADARSAGYLILVEGESDCWTLWHHGFPALGIPGANMAAKLEGAHVAEIARLYLVREPGQSGATFTIQIAKRLRRVGWSGAAVELSCGVAKDPNELHQANPEEFKAAFQSFLNAATPLAQNASDGSPRDDLDSTGDPLRDSGLDTLGLNPSLAEVEEGLRKLAELVAGEDDLRKTVIREAAIAKLASCGLKAPAKLVDATFGISDSDSGHEGQGRSLILESPTPWPEVVSGAELLDEFIGVFRRYVVMVEGGDVAIALWALHAHAFDAWSISPFLTLVSPERRCGKTTTLDLVGALVPRKLPAANISPAALFRTVEIVTPTLLIDEADTFLTRNEDLRGILNAGHTKSTAVVIRTVGEDHEPRQFSTWSPKAIASIGSLPPTIEDRSIVIPMRRRAKGETVARLRRDRIDAELEILRRKAGRWAADHVGELRDAEPEVPVELHDRGQDNWRPLIAIADAAGGDWPGRARRAALALNGADGVDDQSLGVRLLGDLQNVFQLEEADQLPSEQLLKALLGIEDGPWADYNRGRGLTVNGLAKLLKPFSIKPRTIRVGDKTPKGYRLADLEDAFARYLPSQPQQPQQARNGDETDHFSNRNIPPSVAVAETPEMERNDNVVAGVAGPEPESSGNTPSQPLLPFTSLPPVEEWEL
jgi:putative DNA primase/helicase